MSWLGSNNRSILRSISYCFGAQVWFYYLAGVLLLLLFSFLVNHLTVNHLKQKSVETYLTFFNNLFVPKMRYKARMGTVSDELYEVCPALSYAAHNRLGETGGIFNWRATKNCVKLCWKISKCICSWKYNKNVNFLSLDKTQRKLM